MRGVTNRKGANASHATGTTTLTPPPSSASLRRTASGFPILRKMSTPKQAQSLCFIGLIVSLLLLWFSFLYHLIDTKSVRFFHGRQWLLRHRRQQTKMHPFCQFRRYGAHRFYNVQRAKETSKGAVAKTAVTAYVQPDFLTRAEYIHGDWPILLSEYEAPTKLCVNQSEWFDYAKANIPTAAATSVRSPGQSGPPKWPFADGTNPSMVHLSRLRAQAPHVARQLLQLYPTVEYVVTVCMTNSQCTWKDNDAVTGKRDGTVDLPDVTQTQPDTVRTVLQLLTSEWETLVETTIGLHRDAPWGKRYRDVPPPDASPQGVLPGLDDARLFVYHANLYVSYREGPGFGYDTQVVNRIHLDMAPFTATLKASETFSFCCGRNMALMPDYPVPITSTTALRTSPPLHALTWVDPVTVEQVDTTPLVDRTKPPKKRRLQRTHQNLPSVTTVQRGNETWTRALPLSGRRLRDTKHKSQIHGTNAFMVPLPSGALLGVAHFHRPQDRKPNEYARFGHHYTHAFYTVSSSNSDTSTRLFRLTGLSSEFVLPAAHHADNAEMIQFVSGLEYNPDTQQVILAYGINDCEAAVTTLDLSTVLTMLKPVADGQQVVDFMFPLESPVT